MKIKKYKSFIKESVKQAISIPFRNNEPYCYDNKIKHGEVGYDELPNLNPIVVDEFIEEIIRCVEVNHKVLKENLSDKIETSIRQVMGKYYDDYYFKPVDEEENSKTSVFRYIDLSLALAKLINLGYTIGYLNNKYEIGGWRYSEFFGYNGELFDKDFKKTSSKSLGYNGPDVTHSSILAGSYNIKQTLSKQNIKYSVEEQGGSEISLILSRAFSYGFDSGCKMVDLESNFHFIKIGTTKNRYRELLHKDNKTEEEEKEFDGYIRKEDIIKYGEERVLEIEKERAEFDLLPDEEKQRRREKSKAELRKLLSGL